LSSILKALKKIEGRKVDKRLPAWPYGTGHLESMDNHIHRSRQRQKILGLLIILCVAALAGKLYIGSRSVPEKAGLQNTAAQNAQPSTASPPEKAAETAESKPPKTVEVAARSTPEPASGPPSGEVSPETVLPTPSPAEGTSPETSTPVVVSPPPVESGESVAMEEIFETTTTETFATPPANNAGLSLMALVWTAQPESRFVVINGTIVREGGNIEGSNVVRIDEDYVVVKTDGATWQLK
jgi:hypothetical protein